MLSQRFFHDEQAAYDFLESIVWPNGPVCPHCGGVERIGKMGGKSTRIGTYKCYQCRKPFTVKVGTQRILLFEVVQELLLFVAGRDRGATARITLSRSDGCHLVEIEPGGEGIDFGRAPERARGVRPLAYDVLEHIDERLWHVGGQLRVEPDRRQARRIVLATGIELAQAAE